MLVYSVTSRVSFNVLGELRRKVEEAKRAAHVPVIVVGNKADLAHYREVTQDEGKNIQEESLSLSFSLLLSLFLSLCSLSLSLFTVLFLSLFLSLSRKGKF